MVDSSGNYSVKNLVSREVVQCPQKMKLFLAFSCFVTLAIAAPANEIKSLPLGPFEPTQAVELLHPPLMEMPLYPRLPVERDIGLRQRILDEIMLRRQFADLPTNLPDIMDTNFPRFESKLDFPPLDDTFERARFLWALHAPIINPEWRENLSSIHRNSEFLGGNIGRYYNSDDFIRDHWMLFQSYPYAKQIRHLFPRTL